MAKKDKSADNENSAVDDNDKSKRGWLGLGGGGSKEDDSKDEQSENDDDNAKSSQRKRGFFRRGGKDGDDQSKNNDGNASNAKKRKRDDKKRTSGGGQDEADEEDSESSGGFFRRILRSRSGEDGDTAKGKDDGKNKKKSDEDNKKKLGLPSVDINAFVGPRMPDLGSELDVQAELGLSLEEVRRKEKARMAMELAKVKRLEVEKRRQAKIKAAAERAEKLAEERRLAEQKKQEILARQKAVREAAKTKPSPAAKNVKVDAPEARDDGEKSSRWPSLPFGGGNKKKDKSSDEDDTSKSKADKKDGGGGIGSVVSGLSGIFGGGGSEKEQPGEWIVVCPKTRIAPGIIVPVVVGGLDLLIVVSKDGKRLACISNSCPHLGTPLETGIIERRPVAGAAAQKPDVADDGCEDCIVCPTHNTAFALASGEVRGEWCPYPPVIGSMMGAVKTQQNLPTFEIRARGKNIEVRLASSLDDKKD